ncbi:MAG: protein kinase [Oscillospiraceae bacterium]|nr:protein kinase [Oscillospiraceae bacterium]
MENLQSSLPGWEIVRCIGSGSSGKVYELKKKDEYGGDFHCALKVISVPGSQKEYDEMLETMSEFAMRAKLREKVEEISNEYRLLGALRGHPNVVNCEDQMIIPHENDMGWDIYIRMELLQSLPDYVRENGMTVENVIKLGSDMCSALELCRENNIIHRDIKPQNIFVSRYGVFKLGDFGVAKASTIRTSADKVGTYSYMAPEVYKGKGYDDRVDIYSLGMVLYWLLNERRGPFLPMPPQTPTAEQTTDAQIRRFRGETLPQPKNGGAALKKVVMTACSYKIADRYSDPAEFKRALKLAAQGKAEPEPVQPSFGSDEATVREDFKADPRPEYIPEMPTEPRPQPKQKPRPEAAQAKKTPPKQAEPEKKPKKSMFGYILALFLIIAAMATAIIVFALSGSDGGKDDQPKESVRPTPTATPEPEKLDVKSVMLSSPSLTLTVEDEAQLKVSCMPEPAAGQDEPEYVWKSSDTSIVTVSQDGKLTAVSEGSATIMVYVKDKMDVYDQCTVIVERPKVTELTIEEMPVKTVYTVGEELDTTGLVLRAYYNNGSAKRITDPSEYSVECDMTGLGNREATVSYDGKTVTYTVRISLFG